MREKRSTLEKNSEKFNLKKIAKKRKVLERGITLIALVVTIIILLILAGVTLNIALSDNGLFSKTKDAAEKYKLAQDNETDLLDEVEDEINELETKTKIEKVTDTKPGQLEQKSDNVYEIGSIEDLIAFSYEVRNGNTFDGKTVELKQNLDFNSNKSYVDPKSTAYEKYGYTGNIKDAIKNKGFTPIGSVYSGDTDKFFEGTFEGNGFKICNLYVKLDLEDNGEELFIGGFFTTNDGTIENLKIENGNVNVKANNKGWFAVGMLMAAQSGMVKNCATSGTVNVKSNSKSNIGGFCGGRSEER